MEFKLNMTFGTYENMALKLHSYFSREKDYIIHFFVTHFQIHLIAIESIDLLDISKRTLKTWMDEDWKYQV